MIEELKCRKEEKNMMDVREKTCEICGREFEFIYKGGREPKFCPVCANDKKKSYQAKYYLNRTKIKRQLRKEDKKKLITKIDSDAVNVKAKDLNEESKVVYKNFDQQDYVQRLINFANDIDQIRVNLCDFSKELSYYQSSYDRADQLFMHQIENIDPTNVYEVQKFMDDFKKQRNQRRDVKDIILIVSNLIDSLPYKCYTNVIRKIKQATPVEK